MKYTHFYASVFLYFFIGCAPYQPILSYTSDVSENRKLWHGYGYNQVYELRHDMFLESVQKHIFVITPPSELTKIIGNLMYRSPPTIDEYNKLYNNWPEVIGIVTKGTKIRCVRLKKSTTINLFDTGSIVYIYAKILDGSYTDKEVEISDLSFYEKKDSIFLLKPNLNLIHPVDDNP